MPDHDHAEYATRTELNGFGGRVDGLKERVASQEAKMNRADRDVEKLFELVERNIKTVHDFQVTSQALVSTVQLSCEKSMANVDKKVSALKWWLVGGLGVIVIMMKTLPGLAKLFGG